MAIKYNPLSGQFDLVGSSGSGGAVDSVTASNSTLSISPTTGAVLAAVNQGANFSWTGTHDFSLGATVADVAYGPAWNASLQVPTRNAVYDKIQSLVTGVSAVSAGNTSVTVSPTTGNVIVSVNEANDFNWTGTHNFGNFIHSVYGWQSSVGGSGILLLDGTNTRLADDAGITIDGGFVQMQNFGTDFLYSDGVSITISLPITSTQSITTPFIYTQQVESPSALSFVASGGISFADDNGTTIYGGPIVISSDDYGFGSSISLSTLAVGSDINISPERRLNVSKPIKMASNTLGTITDGLIEYNGTHLYVGIGASRYQLDQQSLGFSFENRTSDPGSPTVGQVWLRTDL